MKRSFYADDPDHDFAGIVPETPGGFLISRDDRYRYSLIHGSVLYQKKHAGRQYREE